MLWRKTAALAETSDQSTRRQKRLEPAKHIKKTINMTNSLKPTAAAIFLFVVTVSPLPAQNNPRTGTSNGIAAMAESPGGTNRDAQFTPSDNSGMRAGDPNSVNVKMPRTRTPGWLSVPLGFFVTPVVILAVIFHSKHRRIKMMHETLRAMIDKGVPMTPELIASLKPRNDERGRSKCYLLADLERRGRAAMGGLTLCFRFEPARLVPSPLPTHSAKRENRHSHGSYLGFAAAWMAR